MWLITFIIAFTSLLITPVHSQTINTTHTLHPLRSSSLPAPIPFSDLPTLYLGATYPQPATVIAQILNTLSIYPLAIDGKNFASLSEVFTENVITNYSAPLNVLTSLSVVEAALEAALAPVDTQHAYGTQIVELLGEGEARSVSYFTATHFGRGKYVGQVVYAYGQYQDTWVRLEGDKWRITTRSLVYMGPLIGHLSIFTPET